MRCQEPPAQREQHPVRWCSCLLKTTGNYFSRSAKISTFGTRVEVLNHYFLKILYSVHNYIKSNTCLIKSACKIFSNHYIEYVKKKNPQDNVSPLPWGPIITKGVTILSTSFIKNKTHYQTKARANLLSGKEVYHGKNW